jgi:ribose transport system ATP-binding protein
VISSDLPEVLRMSHRVVVMCEGRITGELSADEATQEKVMHFATLRAAPESGSGPGDGSGDAASTASTASVPPADGNGRQEMVR